MGDFAEDDPNQPSERLEARLEELWSMTNTLRQQLEQRDTEHIISLQHTINLLMEENVALSEDAKTLRTQLWMAQKRIAELEEHDISNDGEEEEEEEEHKASEEDSPQQIGRDCHSWFMNEAAEMDAIKLSSHETQTSIDGGGPSRESTPSKPDDSRLSSCSSNSISKFKSLSINIEGPRRGDIVCCEPCVERPEPSLIAKRSLTPSSIRHGDAEQEQPAGKGKTIEVTGKDGPLKKQRSEQNQNVREAVRDEVRDRERKIYRLMDISGNLESGPDGGIQPWGQQQQPPDYIGHSKAQCPTSSALSTLPPDAGRGTRRFVGRYSNNPTGWVERPAAQPAKDKMRRHSAGATNRQQPPVLQVLVEPPPDSPSDGRSRPLISVLSDGTANSTSSKSMSSATPREEFSPGRTQKTPDVPRTVIDVAAEIGRLPGEGRPGECRSPISRPSPYTQPYRHSSTALQPKRRALRAPPCANSPSIRGTELANGTRKVEERSHSTPVPPPAPQRSSINVSGHRRSVRASSHQVVRSPRQTEGARAGVHQQMASSNNAVPTRTILGHTAAGPMLRKLRSPSPNQTALNIGANPSSDLVPADNSVPKIAAVPGHHQNPVPKPSANKPPHKALQFAGATLSVQNSTVGSSPGRPTSGRMSPPRPRTPTRTTGRNSPARSSPQRAAPVSTSPAISPPVGASPTMLDQIELAFTQLLSTPSPTKLALNDASPASNLSGSASPVRHLWGPGFSAQRLARCSPSPTEARLKQELLTKAYDAKLPAPRSQRSVSYPLHPPSKARTKP